MYSFNGELTCQSITPGGMNPGSIPTTPGNLHDEVDLDLQLKSIQFSGTSSIPEMHKNVVVGQELQKKLFALE